MFCIFQNILQTSSVFKKCQWQQQLMAKSDQCWWQYIYKNLLLFQTKCLKALEYSAKIPRLRKIAVHEIYLQDFYKFNWASYCQQFINTWHSFCRTLQMTFTRYGSLKWATFWKRLLKQFVRLMSVGREVSLILRVYNTFNRKTVA